MWKIQYYGIRGWYDLRTSTNVDDVYVVSTFETTEEANAEAASLSDIFEEEFRVVPVSTSEDWTPYC